MKLYDIHNPLRESQKIEAILNLHRNEARNGDLVKFCLNFIFDVFSALLFLGI